uniref:RRM domain-containing protein n=1 Tax=Ditylenchus dipsaci TaxID=166011 RepID=A0A915CQS4_9BILA
MVISCCSREVKPASRKEGGEQKVVPPPSTANPPPISITPLDLDHHYNFEPTSSTSSKPSSSSRMTQERLKDFFAGFGRVQKVLKVASDVEGVDKEAYIVSFMDVRSAQKACSSHGGEPKLDGHQLRIQFHEPNMSSSSSTKNSAPSPTLAAGNQPFDRTIPSELITEELPKRTKNPALLDPPPQCPLWSILMRKKKR